MGRRLSEFDVRQMMVILGLIAGLDEELPTKAGSCRSNWRY